MPAQPEPHPGSPTYMCMPLPAKPWPATKLFWRPTCAKALGPRPPSRLALRLGTCVVELTLSGAVPVATVEINCLVALIFPVTLWLRLKLLVPPTLAKALEARPPNWLALRLATCVVELTTSGAVPVATVETSCLPVSSPEALRETPVSAGVPVPEAYNRLNFPEGLELLLPTGSSCQRKCWLTAACVLLSKAEASESSGWES